MAIWWSWPIFECGFAGFPGYLMPDDWRFFTYGLVAFSAYGPAVSSSCKSCCLCLHVYCNRSPPEYSAGISRTVERLGKGCSRSLLGLCGNAVEVIHGALRVCGSAEDRAVVILQDLKPGCDVGAVILANLGSDPQISAKVG